MGTRAPVVGLAALICAIGFGGVAQAVEPNDDFTTATGPLTAGKTLKGALTTVNDVDFFYFYIPNTTQVSVTTTNSAKASKGPSGKTIASFLQRGRKGRTPVPLADTGRAVRPGKSATVAVTLVPGKYFLPVVHAASATEPASNVPYKLRIGPVGSTTNSFEIFARRCKDSLAKVRRIKSSKKNTARRLARAKRHGSGKQARKLKQKLRAKRSKIGEAQRVKRIVCSVPQ